MWMSQCQIKRRALSSPSRLACPCHQPQLDSPMHCLGHAPNLPPQVLLHSSTGPQACWSTTLLVISVSRQMLLCGWGHLRNSPNTLGCRFAFCGRRHQAGGSTTDLNLSPATLWHTKAFRATVTGPVEGSLVGFGGRLKFVKPTSLKRGGEGLLVGHFHLANMLVLMK